MPVEIQSLKTLSLQSNNLDNFKEKYSSAKNLFEEYLYEYFSKLSDIDAKLKESIEYSLFNGGKRFRPVLSILTSETIGIPPQKILPFAAAVEFIHTYSLIHDDLPCMDNDDFRRGKPTNHKVFGESIALLAGDALLTEAFLILSKNYSTTLPIQILSEAAGTRGMVDGQVRDMNAKSAYTDINELEKIHNKKTALLISASVEGVAAICGIPLDNRLLFKKFGQLLGYAFQLKDDLQDSKIKIEKGSIPSSIGIEKTQDLLGQITSQARQILVSLNITQGPLHDMLLLNMERSQ